MFVILFYNQFVFREYKEINHFTPSFDLIVNVDSLHLHRALRVRKYEESFILQATKKLVTELKDRIYY